MRIYVRVREIYSREISILAYAAEREFGGCWICVLQEKKKHYDIKFIKNEIFVSREQEIIAISNLNNKNENNVMIPFDI